MALPRPARLDRRPRPDQAPAPGNGPAVRSGDTIERRVLLGLTLTAVVVAAVFPLVFAERFAVLNLQRVAAARPSTEDRFGRQASMATEHAEAFEYDTLVERSVSLAHQLAARRAPTGHELAGQGEHAQILLAAEIADTLSQGLASMTLAILAAGRAIARAADGQATTESASGFLSVLSAAVNGDTEGSEPPTQN